MKRHVRHSKYEPLVDEVDLLEANPQYAYVRLPDGRETTVSVKHLAPSGKDQNSNVSEGMEEAGEGEEPALQSDEREEPATNSDPDVLEQTPHVCDTLQPEALRRSTRASKPPDRLLYSQ